MATLDDFLPEIKMRAYGVSDPVAEMYLRSTIIEFCERTRLWVKLVQEWAFPDDGRIVLASIDDDNEVLECVIPGWNPGHTLMGVIAPQNVDMSAFAGMTFEGQAKGRPQYVFQLPEEVNTVGVWPVPDQQYSDINFTIALKPARAAIEFPDFLADHYRQAMIEGTLAKLKEIPGQTFTDPVAADRSLKRFENAKLAAEVDARRGRTVTGELSVQMRPFALGRR